MILKAIIEQEMDRRGKLKMRLLKASSTTSAIERIARRLEPQLRKRFLEAVKASQDRVDIEQLAQAVLSGNMKSAEIAAKLQEWPERYGEMAIDLRAGFIAGGGVAFEVIGGAETGFKFDAINPYAVDYARRKLPQIVHNYVEGAKETIRAIITDATDGKYTPQTAARAIRDSIGLTPQYERAVSNYRQELIVQGVDGERLETKVEKYYTKLLNSRAKTIARTEIIQAEVSGQRALWNEAANQGIFDRHTATRVWKTNHEGETKRGNPTPCPLCGPLDGQSIPFNGVYTHPELGNVNVFREALHGPPLHPNCLCHEELHT